MSVQPPPDNSETYCTTREVADFFQKYEDFDSSSNPTASEVERRIRAASNWIDDYTGHAWRERRVVDSMKDYRSQYYWRAGMPLYLMKRDIRVPLKSAQDLLDESGNGIDTQEEAERRADELLVWQGNGYRDWVEDDELRYGRDQDYWIDERQGHLYIYRRRLWFRRHKEIKLSYRYGKKRVPQTIRDICAKRAAAYLLETQQYRVTTPGNEEAPDDLKVSERWKEECKEELKPYKEIRGQGMGSAF